jgi:sarcosine oxidase subunit beta
MKDRADTVIIGGGVMGLSISYQLAKLGQADQIVLEKSYLAAGASGRNGGGIRQQWSTELNVSLMRDSLAMCKRFAQELGVNIWLRQGGYLFVARTRTELARLEKNVATQNRLGLETRLIDPRQIQAIVPELDIKGVVGGTYNPTDGILFPWPFLWGYAERATELGAAIYTQTTVKAIEPAAPGYVVRTDKGDVRCRRVINAAGAHSQDIAEMVGLRLPTYPMRHEICSSEPLKPFLQPMVSELTSGLYFSQSMRGEIVGGVSLSGEAPSQSVGSRLKFLSTYASRLVRLMPILGDVKVLRQWAGPYDVSEDGNPIVGAPRQTPEFYLVSGFVGHGFMMAPIIGKLYAAYLANGERHEIFDYWRLERFTEGGGAPREDFNIG